MVCALYCLRAWTTECDLAQEGLTASKQGDGVLVAWDGEGASRLGMLLATASGVPTVRELSVQARGGAWNMLGRDLTPEFAVLTGVRRWRRLIMDIGLSGDRL